MTNRWYLDTEFLEDGRTIDLISIALVSDDGKTEYYAGNASCDVWRCMSDKWIFDHVWHHLPAGPGNNLGSFWKLRHEIAADILALVGIVGGVAQRGTPEFWADFAAYDWVALCQLYGKMIQLPSGMPMYCMDLQQELVFRGMPRADLPVQDPETEHSALEDARWLRRAHRYTQGSNW